MNRWDYSKQFSNYHFDPTVDEDDAPHYKIIGNVGIDLYKVYQEQLEKHDLVLSGFFNRLSVQANKDDVPFTSVYDEEELKFLNLDPDHKFFYCLDANDNPTVQKIINFFGFEKYGATFHTQKPGQLFPYHIDELPGIKNNQKISWLDEDPKWAARFEIQVLDWVPGHVWAVGNTYWKQWKAGEILWHDWRHTPHGTCNFGRSERITLQITGLCTEKTIEIINSNKSISVV